MANTAQARKRARQSVKRNRRNSSLRSMFRTAIKRAKQAIDSGNKIAARLALRKTTSTIDRIANKNIVHINKAARYKSSLAAAVKKLDQAIVTELATEKER